MEKWAFHTVRLSLLSLDKNGNLGSLQCHLDQSSHDIVDCIAKSWDFMSVMIVKMLEKLLKPLFCS